MNCAPMQSKLQLNARPAAKLSSRVKPCSGVRDCRCSTTTTTDTRAISTALPVLMHSEAKLGSDQPPCINTALPLALLSAIFEQLGCHDLVRCQLVCKLWNAQAKEQDRCCLVPLLRRSQVDSLPSAGRRAHAC